MLNVIYNEQPTAVTYMILPNGQADVWLRKDIKETEQVYENETLKMWEAKEVYFRDTISLEEVESSFDKLWYKHGYPAPTDQERIDALENALMEIMEVL